MISLQFMRCMRAAASRLLKLRNSKYQDQTDEEIDEENKQEAEPDSEANTEESEETKEESGEDTEEESYQFHADELWSEQLTYEKFEIKWQTSREIDWKVHETCR